MPLSHFCTLFDRHYLARALAMYRSLERHEPEFTLRAVCMDEESEGLLRRIDAPRLEVIALSELESFDPELLAVRDQRTRVEYYWTATPAVCRFMLEREPGLDAITYLDADVFFFAPAGELFEGMGEASIVLVPHRYSPEYRQCNVINGTSEDSGGIFNVQLVTFRRDRVGEAAIEWWRERCLEWCHDRIEPGRYGDQKYLDDWPDRFGGVHVLENPGEGLAPWNVSQYQLEDRDGTLLVDGQPVVFHHFQCLWLHRPTLLARALASTPTGYWRARREPGLVWATGWHPSEHVLNVLWAPYVERISEALDELRVAGAGPEIGVDPLSARLVVGRVARRYLPASARRLYWRLRRGRDAGQSLKSTSPAASA